jgi:hypothetical protein
VTTAAPPSPIAWVLRIAKIAIVAGALVAAVTVRVIVAGEREIALSTAALRAGDPHEAAVHARRAAGFYAPGAPHVRVAYERLIALATKAETRGDSKLAAFAWQGVRTAAMETRWLVTPHAEDLERANAALARLQAAEQRTPRHAHGAHRHAGARRARRAHPGRGAAHPVGRRARRRLPRVDDRRDRRRASRGDEHRTARVVARANAGGDHGGGRARVAGGHLAGVSEAADGFTPRDLMA